MDPANAFDLEARAREHLDKALNFQRMGMASSAEHELNLARQANPAIVAEAGYQAFHAQKAEHENQAEAWKLPMRVGAGILISEALVSLLVLLLGLAMGQVTTLIWGLVHIGINIYLSITLLQLKDTGRRATLFWAVLGLVIGTISNLGTGLWLEAIAQLSFSGAVLVLLFRRPAKWRVGVAAAIFILGYFGSLCAIVTNAFLSVVP